MMGPYMCPGYWGPADVWTTEYQHGTLIIDMTDAATHKMVWRTIGIGRQEQGHRAG